MRRLVFLLSTLLILAMSAVLVQAQINARVVELAGFLNLRSAPDRNASVVAEIAGKTPLTVIGRTTGNSWFQVQTPDGATGWVSARYVELIGTPLAAIPVIEVAGSSSSETGSETGSSEGTTNTSTGGTAVGGFIGRVIPTLLNVRSSASTSSSVLAELPENTQVSIIGRNRNASWLYIQTAEGVSGWVSARFVDTSASLISLPVVTANAIVSPGTGSQGATGGDGFVPPAVSGEAPYFFLGASPVNIAATGRTNGVRANVFSKLGDSITSSPEMFTPMGQGAARLGSYEYLASTLTFFSGSFSRNSLAAGAGWTTADVLNPRYANQTACQQGENPLQCEYRINRPAVALIMFGTNDVTLVPADNFVQNLRVIVEFSTFNGVIPVLSTVPYRRGHEAQIDFYNQLIVQVAREYGISLWDYAAVMRTLPDAGISTDGVHPSAPPRGAIDTANFTTSFLRYGYNQRNLTALQALHVIRSVLQ